MRNRVVVTSSSPGIAGDVIDISDNGNDNDGNQFNDHTEVAPRRRHQSRQLRQLL